MTKTIIAISCAIITLTSCRHNTVCYCKIQDVNGVKYPIAKYSLNEQYKKVAEYKCKHIESTIKSNTNYDKDNTSCDIVIYKKNCIGSNVYGGL